MLPPEINIPARATIYDAEHPNPLTIEEIKEKLDSPEIRELLSSPSIIIVNDHHRSTPSGVILKVLADLYSDTAQVAFIAIAGGTHEEPTDQQLSKITYRVEEIFDCEILIHDPLGEEVELKEIGTTSRGTKVKIHPVVLDYDNILCINSVEPHYFAGFTGGIKSIFPGLAAKSSVEQNHSWALDPKALPTNIHDNPLQLDLWEVAEMLDKPIHGIQMVNFQDDIFSIHFGHLRDAFENAVEKSLQIYSRQVENKFDVIVSVVYPPLDRSLYQAQKGIENTKQALKEGGEMILVAKCEHGIGNDAFYQTMKQYSNPEEVLSSLNRENYNFGDHKAFQFASLASKSKITLAGDLSLTQAYKVFANSIKIQELEGYLGELVLQNKSIAIVLDSGSLTLSHKSD